MKLYLNLLVCAMLLALPANASTLPLAEADKHHIISKIESFLNSLESYEADFEQIAYDNSVRKGKLFILKPNRVRLEYSQPDREVLLIDEEFVTHYLPDLDEVNFMPNDGVPIAFLSKSKINLQRDFKIIKINDLNGLYEMTVELSYKNEKNLLSLLFTKDPMDIIKISVLDQNQNLIEMKFLTTKKNAYINPKLFEIKRVD